LESNQTDVLAIGTTEELTESYNKAVIKGKESYDKVLIIEGTVLK
jgi:hypothetical protein